LSRFPIEKPREHEIANHPARRAPGRSTPLAQTSAPVVKVLPAAEDATQETVLIGRASADNMIVIFELEAAKGMWMPMGQPAKWVEHAVAKDEIFHVDPRSKTRIAYANVKFSAVNRDNKKQVSGTLHPMWGGSGLHQGLVDAAGERQVPLQARRQQADRSHAACSRVRPT
jgi:hypothetical protein